MYKPRGLYRSLFVYDNCPYVENVKSVTSSCVVAFRALSKVERAVYTFTDIRLISPPHPPCVYVYASTGVFSRVLSTPPRDVTRRFLHSLPRFRSERYTRFVVGPSTFTPPRRCTTTYTIQRSQQQQSAFVRFDVGDFFFFFVFRRTGGE